MSLIRRQLAQFLIKCGSYELMAEKIRQKIASNPYFHIETVFERFDKFQKGYLIPDDLSQFMLQNKIYPTEIELYIIFRQFDKDRAGVITIQRLKEELLPKQNQKLRKKALQKKYYKGGLRLEIDLEYIISKYFEHKIKEIIDLAKIKLDMLQKQQLITEESFSLIDTQKRGVIQSFADIDRFLRNNGKVLSKQQLIRIFRILTFDRDPVILYQALEQRLDPLVKGYYIGYSQRVAQKHIVHQQHLKQKLLLNTQLAQNSRNRLILNNQIADLNYSNNRLTGIIQQQANQLRLKEEQLRLSRRFARNLY